MVLLEGGHLKWTLANGNDKADWLESRADEFAKHWRVVDHVVDDGGLLDVAK
ncbi:hypothetical protein [Niveibacterium sp.]|uniref:hypothetical protein n=1 Tax=Niveibacterium sp. TaxID=2017444 RepID=UPI0035B28329